MKGNILNPKSKIFICLFSVFICAIKNSSVQWFEEQFKALENSYNLKAMEKFLTEVQTLKKSNGDQFHFLECRALERIFIFKIVLGDENTAKAGKQALACYNVYLERIEKSLQSRIFFNALAHHCLIATWLTTQGWSYCPKYGLVVSRESALLEKLNPHHPLAIRASALRYLIAPSYFGGSFQKAAQTLKPLISSKNATEDDLIIYSLALLALGKQKPAQQIAQSILKQNPKNLFAQKILKNNSITIGLWSTTGKHNIFKKAPK